MKKNNANSFSLALFLLASAGSLAVLTAAACNKDGSSCSRKTSKKAKGTKNSKKRKCPSKKAPKKGKKSKAPAKVAQTMMDENSWTS